MALPDELKGAVEQPVELTVQELLGLFGERTRDLQIVSRIDQELGAAGLVCEPALTSGSSSDRVTVRPASGPPLSERSSGPADSENEWAEEADEADQVVPLSLRIRDLPTARLPEGELVSLTPDDDLQHARMLMLHHRFDQLPVLTGPYVLHGVVSWQSIALAHLRCKTDGLADATAPAPEVRIDAELLTTIPDIYREGFVFVRDTDGGVSGIVTAADLSLEFGRLTGPFLRLGEIERRLRICIHQMGLTARQLRAIAGGRRVASPDDLMMGQVQRVFEHPECWAALSWGLPREEFVAKLNTVRNIRNEVAHFRPNPLTKDQEQALEAFSAMMKKLVP